MATFSNRRERRHSQLVGLTDAAEQAGVHYRTVRRWIERGELAAVRVGPKLLKVKQSDLDKFLAPIGGSAA